MSVHAPHRLHAALAAWQALVGGPLRAAPGRTVLAALTIAIGVALGVAVHLINSSANAEFRRSALQLTGAADLLVRGPRQGFAEELYPRIAALPGVAYASPVVEIEASRTGTGQPLRIIGLDALRAWQLQPGLTITDTGTRADLFDADAIRLSAVAASALGVATGDPLEFQVGTRRITLRVAGILPDGAYRQQVGIMDIAAVQWRFERIGRLSRIDIRLQPTADINTVQRALQALLPPGVHAVTPETESTRSAALTRAYRLNLDMLAMIALFTGAFLVFSSQVLALLRRRPQLALLRTLGLSRQTTLTLLLGEGALIGIIGAGLGIVGGYALAHQLLALTGVDLGAGYFRMLQADLVATPGTLAAFFLLGTAFAVGGSAAPAWEAAHSPPARALHAGDAEDSLRRIATLKPGLAAMAAAAVLLEAPSVAELPIAGYAAIALLLVGSVLIMPQIAGTLLSRLHITPAMPHALALAQVRATPRHAALGIAAILVSFSLVVAMLIMVTSFRASLDDWLVRVLPADLYLRAAASGDTAYLTPAEQARIVRLPGVARVEFLRSQNLLLTAERPPVTLLARDLPEGSADRRLPLVSPAVPLLPGGPPAVWVSELVADIHAWHPGQLISLPIGNTAQPYTVAGIWRDYARQNGAIVIDRALYVERTGDRLVNDAAVWLAPGTVATEVERSLRAAINSATTAEIASAADIRKISLRIFDRTFAITWALEIAALAVGLLGIGLAFSAQALARRREFGVLRHLGMTRREIGIMFAGEGALTAGIGAACGLLAGSIIGLILIHIINRQSFHWSMDFAMPWLALAGLFGVIVLCAAAAAAISARLAMRQEVIHAVREDW